MKINSTYKLREVAGEMIVVNQGNSMTNMVRIISLNDSARWLYEQLQGKEFFEKEVAALLVERYGIAEERAWEDACGWVASLRKGGVLE